MEKLILRCGRFIPPAAGDAETRVKLLESYLARLTEELEHLLYELDGAAAAAAASSAAGLDGGEGGNV